MVSASRNFMEDNFHSAVQYCTDQEMMLADEKIILQKISEEEHGRLNGISVWIPLTRHFVLNIGRTNNACSYKIQAYKHTSISESLCVSVHLCFLGIS